VRATEPGRTVSGRRESRMVPRPILAALVVGLLGSGGCGEAAEPGADPVTVTVPAGASFRSVTDTLAARGLVSSPRLFNLYARIKGADRGVRAGSYAFRPGSSWAILLDDLVTGRVITVAVTIPEGFTLTQMAPRLTGITGESAETILARMQEDSVHIRMELPGPGLEGYLFPDTYRFAEGSPVDRVLDAMVRRYRAAWTPARRARLAELGMSERDLVTLASIIQAEARQVEEMPTISAVYHNRLRLGWPLQADPTVLYALGGHRPRLLFAAIDSVANNPYNTYTNPGLPPGAIGAPGEAALDAALFPLDVDYLFFVARPDGSHIFTRTLAEHNRAREASRREREALERAGPP
jgi:UPF0755 protein